MWTVNKFSSSHSTISTGASRSIENNWYFQNSFSMPFIVNHIASPFIPINLLSYKILAWSRYECCASYVLWWWLLPFSFPTCWVFCWGSYPKKLSFLGYGVLPSGAFIYWQCFLATPQRRVQTCGTYQCSRYTSYPPKSSNTAVFVRDLLFRLLLSSQLTLIFEEIYFAIFHLRPAQYLPEASSAYRQVWYRN